jgi:hypothetical protein
MLRVQACVEAICTWRPQLLHAPQISSESHACRSSSAVLGQHSQHNTHHRLVVD